MQFVKMSEILPDWNILLKVYLICQQVTSLVMSGIIKLVIFSTNSDQYL